MAYTDIRSAIVALLNSVTNIGNVHNRDRWADDWPTFLDQFKATISGSVQVRGWMLSRERVTPIPSDSRKGETYYQHQFVVRGVLGFDDSADTDGTFQALVDAVVDKLNSDKNLSGAVNVDWGKEPCRVRALDLRMFGRVLCHYAEIEYTVGNMETIA